MARSIAGSPRWRASISMSLVALAAALVCAPLASAATPSGTWTAKIGSAGANGTATISAFTSGAGSIVLKVAKLKSSTSHTVVLSNGTCSKIGTTLVKFASVRTNSSGSAARTTTLTAAQVNAIKVAIMGTARMAIRIASGRSVKCGVFVDVGVPPYVVANIAVGRSPSGAAIDPSGVWVTNWWDNTLSRISPATNTVLSVVPVDLTTSQGPEAIASGAGALWLTATDTDADGNSTPGVVKRIDPATGATLATISVGKDPWDIDASAGAVWVANHGSSVMRIDPATNQVVATVPVPNASGVAAGLGAVWVLGTDGTVMRIDAATNQVVTTIPTQTTGAAIATGNGAVWVTHPGYVGQADGSLSRIDPTTNQVVANTPLGAGNPQSLAISGTNVWIGMYDESTVVRISATTNAVLNRVAVSSRVYAIAAATDTAWAVHNLPTPEGGTLPPLGNVSRINATLAVSDPPRPIASPTPSASPTPTPVPTTAVPRLTDLFAGDFFFVATPSGWSWKPSADGKTIGFTGPGYQRMAITTAPSSLGLDEVVAQVDLNIKDNGGGDAEVNEAVTIAGAPCRLRTYHFVNGGVNVYQLDAVCLHNGRAYEITYGNAAGGESADRALFLSMLGTFGFLGAG